MANSYTYIKSDGSQGTVSAATPQLALANAPGIAQHSGVQLVTPIQAAKVDTANTNAAATKLGNAMSSSSTNNVVASSDAAVAHENQVGTVVAGLSVPNYSMTEAKKASDAYMQTLKDYQDRLSQGFQSQLQGLNAGFDQTKADTVVAQKKEDATTNVALTRTGGYLGTQISAVGVLNNLAQQHQTDIASLEVKRATAIQAATDAYNQDSFKIAEAAAKEAKAIEQTIYERTQKFFDNSLNLIQEQRQQTAASMNQADHLAPTLYQDIQHMKPEEAQAYVLGAAQDLKIDPNILMGSINKINLEETQKIQTAVISLAGKYPSANIMPNDDFGTASAKVRGSLEYRLDVAKAETDLSNSRHTAADNQINYSDPRLLIYANSTGKIVASPSEARAVMGYADSLLSGKQIVSNDTPTPALTKGKITEADAKKLLTDAYAQFNKQKDNGVQDADVWSWLATPEAAGYDDTKKATYIMQAGKNPQDFGVYQ